MTRLRGMSLLECLVVIAIMSLLFALLLPALQAVRESARQARCQSNLRQLALAIQNHESARRCLPPGRDGQAGRDHSWATVVLPHLEESGLFHDYDRQVSWDHQNNQTVVATDLAIFLCPLSKHHAPGQTDYGGNYGSSLSGLPPGFGVGDAWDSGVLLAVNAPTFGRPRTSPIRVAQVADGTSHTFLIMEDAGRPAEVGGQWANGHQCFAHEYDSINVHRFNGIYSDHPRGAYVVMLDGSVHFLNEDTPTAVLGALSTRDRAETVNATLN